MSLPEPEELVEQIRQLKAEQNIQAQRMNQIWNLSRVQKYTEALKEVPDGCYGLVVLTVILGSIVILVVTLTIAGVIHP